jgi:hypothetical protein
MNTNSQNPQVGRGFQGLVKAVAEEHFSTRFIDEKDVFVGQPAKEHRFDLVSEDSKIVNECKCYTWTNGNNVPNAKMPTLNEAVLYMRSLPEGTRKILAIKKDVRTSNSETLASYYCRIYGHLLEDISIWEIDNDGNLFIVR